MTYNIFIKLIKIYLNYSNISFFDSPVNFLGLIIFENKLRIIKLLRYLDIFGVLKYYFNIIEYFYFYIYFYIY